MALERKEVLVKLFGPQAALAGTRVCAVSVEPGVTTAGEVLLALGEALPVLSGSLGVSRLAVGHALVGRDVVLSGDEEVALIGMVGGG